MRTINIDKTWIGALIGLVFPFIVFMVYYLVKYPGMGIYRFIYYLNLGQIFASVVTLCVLCNVVVFYLFLWKQKNYGARGVVLSTLLWGGFILYLKITTESL